GHARQMCRDSLKRSLNACRVRRDLQPSAQSTPTSPLDLPVDRNIGNSDLHGRCNLRPCLSRMAIEKPFSLEGGNVLHDGCLAGKAEMILNFASAGRHAFFALLALNKI